MIQGVLSWLFPMPSFDTETNPPLVETTKKVDDLVKEVLLAAKTMQNGQEGHSPNVWKRENFDTATALLKEIPEGNRTAEQQLLQTLVSRYWEPRSEITQLYALKEWTQENLARAQELIAQFPTGVSDRDKALLATLQERIRATPKFLPLTVENIDRFCSSLGSALTDSQNAQIKFFFQEYDKISEKGPFNDAMEILKVFIPSPNPKNYTAAMNAILNPLIVGEAFNIDKLTQENFSNGIRLLSELQNVRGDQAYEQAKRRLNRVLSAYANSQAKKFLQNLQAVQLNPVGIKNSDGSSCFASSWMQLVANNNRLSDVYKANFPGKHVSRVLDQYNQARVSEKAVDNIGLVRGLLPRGKQQDANELANKLHDELRIDKDGNVGDIKFGAKISDQVTNLLTGKTESRKHSSNVHSSYDTPSLQLTFDPNQPRPSLANLLNHVEVVQNGQGQPTYKKRLQFDEAPELMIYQFTRLVGGGVNRTEVDMPLYHTLEAADGTKADMQLQGFIRHLGTASGGHYVSYLAQNGKFWLANDAIISEISAADYLVAARYATTALYATVKKTIPEQKNP